MFACLFGVHNTISLSRLFIVQNTISLSRHEQVCLTRLCFIFKQKFAGLDVNNKTYR